MLALVSRALWSRLPTCCTSTVAAGSLQLTRGTVTVTRNHELDRPYPELDRGPIREIDDYPDRVPIFSKIYETAEVRAQMSDAQQLVTVRLTRDVPGLGETGRTVQVHRSRYWHYLYPLGWASIHQADSQMSKSAAAAAKAVSTVDWRNCRVFTGALYRLQCTLETMQLIVPINRDAVLPAGSSGSSAASQERLSERHVSVAFRRYGLEIPRRAIHLPEKPPPLSAAGRAFKVGVQLNSQVVVSVKCALHHVTLGETGSGLPLAKLPKVEVDDWQTEMYPSVKLPEGARVFERYDRQQGPPDFEKLLGSNKSRVGKNRR